MSDIQQSVAMIVEDHRVEVEKSLADLLNAPPVKMTIDGREITVKPTALAIDPKTNQPFARPTTIYDAALQLGIKIPILCHREHMTPVAVCRFCCVETGPGKLTPACHRQVENGMAVKTGATSERVKKSVQVLTELLLADHDTPREAHREYGDNELRSIARQFGLDPHSSRFPRTAKDRGQDESSLVIAVDHNACILCDRCVRGCNEIRNNQVIGRMGKGYRARIAFDLNDPMGKSSCVSCGECMVSCPTGALTNRKAVQAKLGGDTVKAQELFDHPLFQGVSVQFLGWNEGAVVRKHFKAGEIICREGEFGNSAFIIEKGELEVYINSPIASAKRDTSESGRTGLFGLFRSFTTKLLGGSAKKPDDEEETTRRFIPVDAPVALEMKPGVKPAAMLTADDVIFGEMSCMNNYPRSATVRAKTDVVVLEILRNVLYILQRNKKSKAILDSVYSRRAIESQLRSVPIFAELQKDERQFQDFVAKFKDRMTLVRYNPGEVIFKQNDRADSFYLVKVGFVKVSLRQPGGEHVLSYVGPGGYFGEIGLMATLTELQGLGLTGKRTATCQALDHVDAVKIKGDDFQAIVKDFPGVRDYLVKVARKRLEDNEAYLQSTKSQSMGEFVRQGLMNARSLLVLDLQKCTRCDECTKACSDSHEGVTRLIREGLRFENWLVASSCRSCLDPYCMVGCPVDSIHRSTKTREMRIESWCIGCGTCAKNCPYGNINMHGIETDEMAEDPITGGKKAVMRHKATMCDLCVGLHEEPSCVYACPHDAAHRYDADEFKGMLQVQLAKR